MGTRSWRENIASRHRPLMNKRDTSKVARRSSSLAFAAATRSGAMVLEACVVWYACELCLHPATAQSNSSSAASTIRSLCAMEITLPPARMLRVMRSICSSMPRYLGSHAMCEHAVQTGANPESTVGLITMAGKRPEVLVTLTNDLGKLLPPLATLPTSGQIDFPTGMQVAQVSSSPLRRLFAS